MTTKPKVSTREPASLNGTQSSNADSVYGRVEGVGGVVYDIWVIHVRRLCCLDYGIYGVTMVYIMFQSSHVSYDKKYT